MNISKKELGMSLPMVLVVVGFSLAIVAFASFGVWAYMQYSQQKTNVDGKISQAVAAAEKAQAEEDEAKFIEREKQPNIEFAGPSDYGSLSFKYPKTWSVYVANDAKEGGDYEAYLNPRLVPPVDDATRFALRVTIREENYSTVIEEYQDSVSDGSLKSTTIKFGDETGTRLDGKISDDIRGAVVLFKIRDKTAVLQTDADTFKTDFDALVKTIKFND